MKSIHWCGWCGRSFYIFFKNKKQIDFISYLIHRFPPPPPYDLAANSFLWTIAFIAFNFSSSSQLFALMSKLTILLFFSKVALNTTTSLSFSALLLKSKMHRLFSGSLKTTLNAVVLSLPKLLLLMFNRVKLSLSLNPSNNIRPPSSVSLFNLMLRSLRLSLVLRALPKYLPPSA